MVARTHPTSGHGAALDEATRLAEELRRVNAELEAERAKLVEINAELERFADVAAHDLRSPLRAMSSFAGLLRRRLGDRATGEELELLDHVIGGAGRLSAMVEGILAMAKARHQDFTATETVDLPTLVGECADLVDPSQCHHIAFDGAVPRIKTSPTALRQIVLNLVSNAVKYHDRPAGRIIVRCAAEADAYRLSVSDDGPGIAASDQARIFEAFETGANAPRVPSTGLGLALVRRVVDRLGGEVTLRSRGGEGSTFEVTLPR